MGDLHWDNPKCNRVLLRRHLDYCKEQDIPIVMVGDLFCLMQGKYDPRRNKSDIRPEHNKANYLDAIVETAVAYFRPYAHLLHVVGYGNHETAILKNCETDIIERFCTALGRPELIGGYGGWVVYQLQYRKGGLRKRVRCKYFHGSGGGGPVTRGTIQAQRMLAQVHGADVVIQGHVHESWTMVNSVERLNHKDHIELAEVLHIRVPTYKEEYGDGSKGWHVERGAPPKPLGCYIMEMQLLADRIQVAAYALRC